MSRRFYIGFDIGDAESIIEFSITGTESVQPATMPGKNAAGQAIPTLFGYDNNGKVVLADTVASDYENLKSVEMNFKRRPSDLVIVSPERERELLLLDAPQIWGEPEFKIGAIKDFAEKLVQFINIILLDAKFLERAKAYAAGCADCAICVGHPTNWNPFDKFIYKSILQKSILGEKSYLGLPLDFTLECESRAAFLYIKNTYQVKLEANEFVGLMDIGSSTIDISVLTKDSRNCIYDSGNNYLGARIIDYLILEYYIERSCSDEADKHLLDDILSNNPASREHLLLNCRLAKESIFSAADADKSRISAKILFADFRPFRLTYDALVNDICNRPIAPVLKKYCALPDEYCKNLGNMGWIEAFRNYVQSEMVKMKQESDIDLSKLFLTGSASRMDFIRLICLEELPQLSRGDSLFDDTNPSNAIAHGLARVGASEHKAAAFQADMNKFFDKGEGELFRIINSRIPDLISAMADPIINLIQNKVILPEIEKWKKGEYKTLQLMLEQIESQCKDELYFGRLLKNDAAFSSAIKIWSIDQVGNDIALALQRIAAKHLVYDFTLGDLNALKSAVGLKGTAKHSGSTVILQHTPADKIATMISGIAAIAAYFVIPIVIGIVLSVLTPVFSSLVFSIVVALQAGGPAAWIFTGGVILLSLLTGKKIHDVYKYNKDKIDDILCKADLPMFIREKIKTEDMSKQFNEDRASTVAEVTAKMKTPKAIEDMSRQIYTEVYPQVETRSNQIKYIIENR